MKYRQVGGHTQGRHMEDWIISRSPGSGDYCWVHFKAFPCCQQEKVTIGDRIRCWLSGPSVRKLLVSFLAHGGHSGAIAGVVLGCGGEGAFKIWSGGLVGQNPCDRLPCLNRLPRFVVKFDSDMFRTWSASKHLSPVKEKVANLQRVSGID